MPSQSEVITTFIPWTDTSKHSAAFKLFKYTFICSIAQMHLYSEAHMAAFGYVTSGDKAIDRALGETKAHAQFSIAQLAEFHDQGIPFHIVTPQDSVKIYEIIHQHLTDWSRRLEDNHNATSAPIEDLRKLDALAGEVYQVAKHFMSVRPFHGRLVDNLEALTKRRGGIRRHLADPNKPTSVPQVPSAHTPMADSIAKKLSERRRPWRT